VPEGTLVAAIGPQTAKDARQYGLRVDVIADDRSASSLIDAVVAAAAQGDSEASESSSQSR
jgi:uroporphyrinogen-III synthase